MKPLPAMAGAWGRANYNTLSLSSPAAPPSRPHPQYEGVDVLATLVLSLDDSFAAALTPILDALETLAAARGAWGSATAPACLLVGA